MLCNSRNPWPGWLAMIVVAGWLAACGGDSSSSVTPHPGSTADPATESSPDGSSAEAAVDRYKVEIPLDESLSGNEATLTRNFYFIIDGSGSMARKTGRACRGDQHFRDRLAGAQWAVHQFLGNVPEDVNMGLYVFDTRGQREVVPLGSGNRDEFLSAVNSIWAGGGTPLASAIVHGTRQLIAQYQHQLGYGEFRLVVVTDGQADKIPEAAYQASRFGIPIYAIGLCIDEDHPLRQHAVSYRAADNFGDLAKGLEETLAELPSFDATEFESE